jgi:hypothetical protein
MDSTSINVVAPRAAPLPDAPTENYFTEVQWTTLMAIMDTVVPCIKRESAFSAPPNLSEDTVPDMICNALTDNLQRSTVDAPNSAQLDQYLAEKPSDNPEFQVLVKRTLMQYSREDARKGLSFLLTAMK